MKLSKTKFPKCYKFINDIIQEHYDDAFFENHKWIKKAAFLKNMQQRLFDDLCEGHRYLTSNKIILPVRSMKLRGDQGLDFFTFEKYSYNVPDEVQEEVL